MEKIQLKIMKRKTNIFEMKILADTKTAEVGFRGEGVAFGKTRIQIYLTIEIQIHFRIQIQIC